MSKSVGIDMDNAETPRVDHDASADNGWPLGAEWRQGFEQRRRHERQR